VKKLWRRMEISCLDGQRHTYPSITFSRSEILHSTLHQSHWTLSANNPTCCSRPIITSLLLNNTVRRLNRLFKSAVVIWSIRSADILDVHGDRTSRIQLLLVFSPDAAFYIYIRVIIHVHKVWLKTSANTYYRLGIGR